MDIDCITRLDTGYKSPVSISIGHRRFNYHQCQNLNLREISESESDPNSTHVVLADLSFQEKLNTDTIPLDEG